MNPQNNNRLEDRTKSIEKCREQDIALIENLKEQSKNGNTQAEFQLGLMYEDGKYITKDIQECIKWYSKAAPNHPQASFNLASIYYLGRVVAPDYKIAFKYFSKAAEQGSDQGMFQLGLMYLFGQGIDIDYEKCKIWFEKAADLGSVSAMNNLGNMYRSGIGLAVNIQQAKQYYQMAADKQDLCAMTNLATVLLDTQPEEAFKWYQKAAIGGFENAQYNLAVCFEEGTGTKIDLTQALIWYGESSKSGNKDAKEAIQRITPLVNLQKLKNNKQGCGCIIF